MPKHVPKENDGESDGEVKEERKTRQGPWEQKVKNTVDDYPERPLSEARGNNVVFDPSNPEDRAKFIYYDHEVSEVGDVESSRLHLSDLGKKTKGEIPHGDYVEDTEALYPGYNPPVYEDA